MKRREGQVESSENGDDLQNGETDHSSTPAETAGPPPAAPATPAPRRVDLTRGHLGRGIVLLAWPIVTSSFLNWLIGIADIKMVGYLGKEAIAAVGTSQGIIFTLMSVIFAIATGTQVLTARYAGARQMDKVGEVARQTIICSVIFGVLLIPVGLLLSRPLLAMLGAEGEVLTQGAAYLQVFFWGSVLLMLNFMISSALQGAGDTLTPLYLLIFVNAANILLDWLLIFGIGPFPEMGVAGAAWAMVIARGIAAVVMLWIVGSGRFAVHVPLRGRWAIDWAIWSRMFYIGIPSSIQGFTRNISFLILLRILNWTHAGAHAVAAHTVAMQVQAFVVMGGLAMMSAAMTAVGQNLGAQDEKRAERSGWTVAAISFAGSVVAAILIITLGAYMVRFFTADAETIQWGVVALTILALALPFTTGSMAFSGALRGAGDTLSPLWASLICTSGIGPLLAYVLAVYGGLGPAGAWTGSAVAMVAQFLITAAIFKRGRWKKIKL